jgi:hypothetical protein
VAKKRAARRPPEASFEIGAEDVVAPAIYRDTPKTASLAARELWHRHQGKRRIYVRDNLRNVTVETIDPGEVERTEDIACHKPAPESSARKSRRKSRKKPVKHVKVVIEHANSLSYGILCTSPENAYPVLESIKVAACVACLDEILKRGIG